MKKKILGIFICMLVMINAFFAVATTNKQEKSSLEQKTGHLGALLTQLPVDPGYSWADWYAFFSATFLLGSSWQCYENFMNITSPIQGVHWWGLSIKEHDGSYQFDDPVGMTFNITFYKDNNTKPGEIVLSYSDVQPSITATGILYQDVTICELYFFKCDLTLGCNLSNGWISIVSTGSDNNCSLCWLESSTGNHRAFATKDGELDAIPQKGLSLVLTDGGKTNLSIVDMKGGFGITLEIKNNGNQTVDNYPVSFLVYGGRLMRIDINAGKTISGLTPDTTMSLKTGMFFGLGKITIFVVGDGIAAYKQGKQLFIYTIIQNT